MGDEDEFVGPAFGGPCDGKMIRARAQRVQVPVLEGYERRIVISGGKQFEETVPVFGAFIYQRLSTLGWVPASTDS